MDMNSETTYPWLGLAPICSMPRSQQATLTRNIHIIYHINWEYCLSDILLDLSFSLN